MGTNRTADESSRTRTVRWAVYCFLKLAGGLLLLTGLAKVISSFGTSRILQSADPVLGLSFRTLFQEVGAAEVAIGIVCLCFHPAGWQVGLIAWLSGNFIIYRIGLVLVGYHHPCPCLGSLTDALGLSATAADAGMKGVLAFLAVGSYAILLSPKVTLWWGNARGLLTDRGHQEGPRVSSGLKPLD